MNTLKRLTPFLFLLLMSFGCNKDCPVKGPCALEPDPGICEAYIPKYYFDKEKQKCEEFIWGGCDGTVPFDTMEECKECSCN